MYKLIEFKSIIKNGVIVEETETLIKTFNKKYNAYQYLLLKYSNLTKKGNDYEIVKQNSKNLSVVLLYKIINGENNGD